VRGALAYYAQVFTDEGCKAEHHATTGAFRANAPVENPTHSRRKKQTQTRDQAKGQEDRVHCVVPLCYGFPQFRQLKRHINREY